MATIRLSWSPGKPLESVVEAAGSAVVSGLVELTYDQGATAVTDGSLPAGTRPLKVSEIQAAIRVLEQYLIRQADTASS